MFACKQAVSNKWKSAETEREKNYEKVKVDRGLVKPFFCSFIKCREKTWIGNSQAQTWTQNNSMEKIWNIEKWMKRSRCDRTDRETEKNDWIRRFWHRVLPSLSLFVAAEQIERHQVILTSFIVNSSANNFNNEFRVMMKISKWKWGKNKLKMIEIDWIKWWMIWT